MNKTTLVLGISKDTPDDVAKERKNDLRKILKFLIRQSSDEESLRILKEKSFYEFCTQLVCLKKSKYLKNMMSVKKSAQRADI